MEELLKISFVIPLINEHDSLEELYRQINELSQESLKGDGLELIFINDGSTDFSLNKLKELQQEDSRIKIISFRKNLGKATALNEGFKKATGDIIVTMDADLQDGPENIPLLLERLDDTTDMVVGWKKERNDPLSKTLPSKLFNSLARKFYDISLHDLNSGLKVMKKEVAKELYLYGELHRFIPVLAVQRGFKVAEIPVVHHARKYGKTKYNLSSRFKGLLDFMTVMFLGRYGTRPLHFFGRLGALSITIGLIFGVYLSVIHFQGVSIYRRPMLILSVFLVLSGLQLLSTGLIAEMIVDTKASSNSLPIDYES